MKAKSVIHGKPVGPPFPRRRPARLNRLGALAVGFRFLEDFRNKVNPVSPTITVVDGASMLGGFYAHNASTIIVTGGRTSSLSGLEFKDSNMKNTYKYGFAGLYGFLIPKPFRENHDFTL